MVNIDVPAGVGAPPLNTQLLFMTNTHTKAIPNTCTCSHMHMPLNGSILFLHYVFHFRIIHFTSVFLLYSNFILPSYCHLYSNFILPSYCHLYSNFILPSYCHLYSNFTLPTSSHLYSNHIPTNTAASN